MNETISFNTTLVQLKATTAKRTNVPCEFQYHTGPIKRGLQLPPPAFLKASFNTTLVQLKASRSY